MPNTAAEIAPSLEKFAVGQPVSRLEDPMLLRGDGCYTDDFSLDGQAYAYVLRSPYAHGAIRSLDVSGAKAAPGVLAVLTIADLEEAGVNPLFCRVRPKNRDGTPMIRPDRPCLAKDKVRYRGEAVAVVVAESLAQAKDASERIELDVEVLPAVTDAREALRDGAPTKHHRSICGGCAYCGDPSSVERLGPSAAKDPSGHRLLETGERPGKAIVRLREAQKDERALANCF